LLRGRMRLLLRLRSLKVPLEEQSEYRKEGKERWEEQIKIEVFVHC